MQDHTGKEIEAGQTAMMDSGHAKGDDWKGDIIERDNVLYFKYVSNGDEVKITGELCALIEVVTYNPLQENEKVKDAYAHLPGFVAPGHYA
jgi:hypothetical protein